MKPLAGKSRPRSGSARPSHYVSRGFVDDLRTGRWMLVPGSSDGEAGDPALTNVETSFRMLLIIVALYLNHHLLVQYGILKHGTTNPFAYILIPSGRLPNGLYSKSWADFLFLANAVVLWSWSVE